MFVVDKGLGGFILVLFFIPILFITFLSFYQGSVLVKADIATGFERPKCRSAAFVT